MENAYGVEILTSSRPFILSVFKKNKGKPEIYVTHLKSASSKYKFEYIECCHALA